MFHLLNSIRSLNMMFWFYLSEIGLDDILLLVQIAKTIDKKVAKNWGNLFLKDIRNLRYE